MSEFLRPDLCVIGAGSAGLSVAAVAAQLGAETVLIERGAMGGDCLNYGCVPSKSLLAAAKAADFWRRGGAFGVAYDPPRIDFATVADKIAEIIGNIAPNDSVERFEGLGVTVLRAEARFTGPRSVRAGTVEVRPRRFVIATGSHPTIPPIPGLDRVPHLTNETIFANRVRPGHLLVIGGGPIGIEMAQAHCRLGSRVTVLDAGPILPRDDPELTELLANRLSGEGVDLRPRVEIAAVESECDGVAVRLADGELVVGSHLLVAAGRRPSVEALDLAAAGITANARGITVDARLRTANRRAYAIGDVAGGPQFTHIAGFHAGIVIRNALFRLPAKVDYRALPWVTYTDPELAQVGADRGAGARHRRGCAAAALALCRQRSGPDRAGDRGHGEDRHGRQRPHSRRVDPRRRGRRSDPALGAGGVAKAQDRRDGQPDRPLPDPRRSRQAGRRQLLRAGIVFAPHPRHRPVSRPVRLKPAMRTLETSLSARLLVLTAFFVMVSEVLIFVPSVARFRMTYFENHLAAGRLATLALEASPTGRLDQDLVSRLLAHVGAHGVELHRTDGMILMLDRPVPPRPRRDDQPVASEHLGRHPGLAHHAVPRR